jgi:hypothetical protein
LPKTQNNILILLALNVKKEAFIDYQGEHRGGLNAELYPVSPYNRGFDVVLK